MSGFFNVFRPAICIAIGVAAGFGARSLRTDSRVIENKSAFENTAEPSAEKGDDQIQRKDDELFSRIVSTVRSDDPLAGRVELHRLLGSMDAPALPGLIERAQKLPLKFRGQMVAAIFGRWLELDRPGAEAWIQAAIRDARCYEQWIKVAPSEALTFAVGHASPAWLSTTVRNALDHLAGKDSAMRLAVLKAVTPSKLRDEVIASEFEEWAKADPGSALAWAAGLPESKLRKSLEQEGVICLVKTDPGRAKDRVKQMIPHLKTTIDGNGFVTRFTSTLAEKDALDALKFAESLSPELKERPLITAGAAWAKNDPLAALEWANANGVDPAKEFREGSVWRSICVLREAFGAKPAQTVDWLIALPEGNERSRWLKYLFKEDLLKGNVELGKRVFAGMSADWQRGFAGEFGSRLAAEGRVPDLTEWTTLFPDETVRARAVGGALGHIFDRTPARAEAILPQLPAGLMRDQALADLSDRQSLSSPRAAALRAMEIQDATMHYDALYETVHRWLQRDRQTSEDWLHTQENLPREWIEEWLSEVQ
jgi:hypothetical protein